TKVVKLGDILRVQVNGLDNGKISLSKKSLEEKPEGYVEPQRSPRNGNGNRGGGFRPNNRGFNR
ncbi:hypothetical protein CO178_02030, partial [candidate division WWE3 bacterium CG_4_9_14_3_um_filter_34_6]